MNEKQEHRRKYMQDYLAKYRENHHEIKITFSNKDYGVIQKIAEKQGMRVATYIRQATHEQSKNLYLFPKELEEQITGAIRNIRGIGNNINQIAKYCNEQGYSSPSALETVFNFLREIENEIKNLKLVIQDKTEKQKHFTN
ncbi:MAG: MobC family plasmid mobilization relaxosome protein [Zoogloeaceae bacterium]|jgi:vacuolar-type H+-ATPase subunit C/Vma6|nr:MobC family plasmid mobilization relaxosome protein [Zoogloeaceae bacterium]